MYGKEQNCFHVRTEKKASMSCYKICVFHCRQGNVMWRTHDFTLKCCNCSIITDQMHTAFLLLDKSSNALFWKEPGKKRRDTNGIIYVCIYVYIHTYTYTHMFIYVYVCVCVSMYASAYIYRYRWRERDGDSSVLLWHMKLLSDRDVTLLHADKPAEVKVRWTCMCVRVSAVTRLLWWWTGPRTEEQPCTLPEPCGNDYNMNTKAEAAQPSRAQHGSAVGPMTI